MNIELLERLGIDKEQPHGELLASLEEALYDKIERAETANDEARKSELEALAREIEQAIEEIKQQQSVISTSIIFDDGSAAPAKKPEELEIIGYDIGAVVGTMSPLFPKQEKQTQEDERIAEMRRKRAEQIAAQEKAKAAATADTPAANTPADSKAADKSYDEGLRRYSAGDYAGALAIFQEEAEKGNAEAQFRTGCMFVFGKGTEVAENRGKFWLKKSADNGFTEAQKRYGELLINSAGLNAAETAEAFRYIALAADKDDMEAARLYVNAAAEKMPYDKKIIKKAMSYCDAVESSTKDSYEKELCKKHREEFKRRLKGNAPASTASSQTNSRPTYSSKPRMGCGGCLWTLIKLAIAVWLIALLVTAVRGYINKVKAQNELASAAANSTVTVEEEAAPFGSDIIELHELAPIEEQCITHSSDHGYIINDSMWNGAFVYRAGNGHAAAYTIYQIDGLFEKITLEATPWQGGSFTKSATADIMIVDAETNSILHTTSINENSGVVTVEAEITGVKKLGVYVNLTSSGLGVLGYTFIRNAYLYPAGMAPETPEEAVCYAIAGNIRSGAGTEFEAILFSDGTQEFTATGETATDTSGATWYEVYIDAEKNTGWAHSTIVTER